MSERNCSDALSERCSENGVSDVYIAFGRRVLVTKIANHKLYLIVLIGDAAED